MAKQNFLSGGYYGKLGMTVGQRWKNIRTIRSYVIPHNPRTPAQQANRGQFGDCVFFAQVGMQLNYKAPCFVAPDKTAWNYRMSVARGLQDLGLQELERFPLYPLNFSIPYQITSANVTEVIDETHIKVSVVGNLPETERVLTMLLLLPGTTDWKERLAVCVGQNSSEDYSSFTFQFPAGIILSNGMQCRFISCDDTDSTTDLIASSQIDLGNIPIDTHEFDTTFISLARSGNTFTLTLNEPYQNGTNTVTITGLRAVVNGAQTNVTPPGATLINNGGKFAVVFTCPETENKNLWAFPSGCEISFGEIKSISPTVHATATNKTVAISDPSDLSRTISDSPTWSDSDNAFIITLASGATISSASGSVSTTTKNHNQFFQKSETSTLTCGYDSNKIKIASPAFDSSTILLSDDSFALPAGLSVVANGVTYNIAAQTVSVTKSGTQTLSATTYEISGAFDSSTVWLTFDNIEPGFDYTSTPTSTTVGYPQIEEFSDIDSQVADADIDSASVTSKSSGAIEFEIGVNLGGTSLNLGDELAVGFSSGEWFISDTQGNKWNLPAQNYTLIPA